MWLATPRAPCCSSCCWTGWGWAATCPRAWSSPALAATTAPAVLVTLRALGAEPVARRAAPFLVLGPAAVWTAVSADAVFAAVGGWGLAVPRTGRHPWQPQGPPGWATAAGVLLGSCLMLSYGLVPPGVPGAGRAHRRAHLAAVSGRGGRSGAGGRWVRAGGIPDVGCLPSAPGALLGRHRCGCVPRPTGCGATWPHCATAPGRCSGPGWASSRRFAGRRGGRWRCWSAEPHCAVLAADLSLMSKAEVERIWLPFVPWLLLSPPHCCPSAGAVPAWHGSWSWRS